MSNSIDPISAKKALESLTGLTTVGPEGAAERHRALDAEELRELEYAEMGIPLPVHLASPQTIGERIRAFLGLRRRV